MIAPDGERNRTQQSVGRSKGCFRCVVCLAGGKLVDGRCLVLGKHWRRSASADAPPCMNTILYAATFFEVDHDLPTCISALLASSARLVLFKHLQMRSLTCSIGDTFQMRAVRRLSGRSWAYAEAENLGFQSRQVNMRGTGVI
jgi:hypothetical protein